MSYQSLNVLVEEIKTGLDQLQNEKLTLAELDEIQRNAQELYERLTVIKYRAAEKLVKNIEELEDESAEPEDPSALQEVVKEATPFRFNIKSIVEEIPENQTNLLDEIKERSEAADDVESKEDSLAPKSEEETIPAQAEQQAVADEESKSEEEVKGKQKTEAKKPKKEKEDESSSLNDKLRGTSEPVSLADKFTKQPIVDLVSAIGINQKFLFMNDLFEGERDAFHQSIEKLNSFDSYLDADNYIKNNLVDKYNWDLESSSAVRFMELVERRYLS